MPASIGQYEIAETEKDLALQALLRSKGLNRSDQLRRFLEYVCQRERDGRGEEISEYLIGVEALGRPVEFSAEADSIVRTRAHELRRRIDDFYHGPGREEHVRIEIPKGTYRPRFYRVALPKESQQLEENPVVELTGQPLGKEAPRNRSLLLVLAGVAIGLVAAAVFPWVQSMVVPPSEEARLLEQVWGPFLDSRTPVAISVSSPVQMWVREFGEMPTPADDPPFSLPAPKDQVFLDWYQRMTQAVPRGLYFHPNNHSPLWGDAAAAVVATRFFAERGIATELIPEVNIRPPALKNRNALIFGRQDYSAAAAANQPQGGFRVEYAPKLRRMVIWDTSLPEDKRTVYARGGEGATSNFGLIQMSTQTTGDGGRRRTIVFSGINSDGSHAGVEFLTAPAKLRVLSDALKKEGIEDWPTVLQIVVKSRSNDTFTIDCEYAAHKVIR
jgi:hypothetical protein